MISFALDFSRFRSIGIVAGGALALFAALSLVLHYGIGPDPQWLHPEEQPTGWTPYEQVGQTIAGLERHFRTRATSQEPLGLILGMSTAQAGFRPALLEAGDSRHAHWLLMYGHGGTLRGLESVIAPFMLSRIRPTTVVLAVHPQMMVGQGYLPDKPPAHEHGNLVQYLKELRVRGVWSAFLKGARVDWVLSNRALISHHACFLLHDLRFALFAKLGLPADALFKPAADPWLDTSSDFHFSDDFARIQLERWEQRGYFRAESYHAEGPQAEALIRLVRQFQQCGAHVYVLLMPERSTLRKRIPAEAKPRLLQVLRTRLADAPPSILDFQDALPDDVFSDHVHLSPQGSVQLSKMTAQKLSE